MALLCLGSASVYATPPEIPPELVKAYQIEFCQKNAEGIIHGSLFTDSGSSFDATILFDPPVDQSKAIDCRYNAFSYPFFAKEGFSIDGGSAGVWMAEPDVQRVLSGDDWKKYTDIKQGKPGDIVIVKTAGKIRLIALLNSVQTSLLSNKHTINMSHKVNLSPVTTVDAPFPFVGVSASDTVELWTPKSK